MSESPDTESLDAEAAAVQNIAELRGSLRAQPDDFGTRIDLAAALLDQDGAADGLDEAVGLLRAAVASAIDVPQWSVALDMLAAALAWRFWQRIDDEAVPLAGVIADLDAAIEALGSLLGLASGDEHREIAGELGGLLLTRLDLEPDRGDDLDSAIRLLEPAAAAEHPDLATVAALGDALAARYDRGDAESDRDAAITSLRRVCDAADRRPLSLIALAQLLADRGDQNADITDITAAIRYAGHSLAVFPADSPHREPLLYLIGICHLRRADLETEGASGSLRIAADHLLRARSLLPATDPDHAEVTAWSGIALATRVGMLSASFRLSKVLARRADQAIRLLSGCEPGLPDTGVLRLRVRYWLGLTRAARYLMLDGAANDRELALAALRGLPDLPGCDAATASTCHYFCAVLLLISPVPRDLLTEFTRYDAVVHKRLMAAAPPAAPARSDATEALEHLDRIADSGESPISASDILDLRGFALIHQPDDGPGAGDLTQAVTYAEEALRLTPATSPDLGMRHVRLAHAHAALAEGRGGTGDYERVVEDLITAAGELDSDHRLQDWVRGMLGESIDRHDRGAPFSAEDSTAAAGIVERALQQIPADHPSRVKVLTRLGEVLLKHTVFDRSAAHLDRIRGLLRESVALPTADEANKAANYYLLGITDGTAASFSGDPGRFDAAVEQLKYAAGLVPRGHPLRVSVLSALAELLSDRYRRGGGLEFLDASVHYAEAALQAMRAAGDASDERAISLEVRLAVASVLRHLGHPDEHGDLRLLEGAMRELEELAARLPGDHPLKRSIELLNERVHLAGSILGPESDAASAGPGSFAAAADAAARMAADFHPDNSAYPLAHAVAGSAKVENGYRRRDRKMLNAGLTILADALDAARSAPPERRRQQDFPAVLSMLGAGLCRRYALTGNGADLSHGIVRLEDARREAGDGWAGTIPVIYDELARAYRARDDRNLGDRRRAAESGLLALRERARDVLLQSTAGRAFDAALSAAGKASDVARWCLEADLADSAIEALEMGRGMVLHSATTEATVPALLRESGQQDLAAEWEAASGAGPAPWDGPRGDGPAGLAELDDLLADLPGARVPSDLRHRVMTAIEDTETERTLLRPPAVAEIAGTLRAAGADTLAYLLPGQDQAPGLGVLVSADGQVREMPLPRLRTDPRSRPGSFADALRELLQAVQAGDKAATAPARRRWRGALADLCDWAWTAAMAELLAAVPAVPGRPSRLVLVPVGELGLVPWHAARRTVTGGARRYACQDAIISYAASARQFVNACRQVPRPLRAEAALVIVSDSAPYWTSRGIERIHRHYYPDGILLGGHNTSGEEATVANVRGLLPGPGSPGASLLLLGAHAEPAEHPVGSRLRLCNQEFLSMADLLRQARSRPADVPGGLIVLAACGTDLTRRAHDEALTLAASFLALGAVGAVGTRWPVQDVPTAIFMTVFQHHLNSGHADPAAALRATQLWMLDPDRVPPASLDPVLAEEMRTAEPEAVDAWAGYTYQGR